MTRRAGETATVRAGLRSVHAEHRPGAPGRVPLLLCAGIGTSSALFGPLSAELDPDRPLLLFDAPGIGRSAPAPVPYRLPSLARTVRAAARRFGYDRVDVLGVSWGGGLAQQYAFQYPQHCRRVVLVATGTGSLMVPAAPRTLGRMLTPRRHNDPDYARRIAGELYGGTARSDGATVAELLHAGESGPPVVPYLFQLAALAGWTSLPFLPFIRQPTLVLIGDDDPLIPGINGTIMTKLLGDGHLHRYRGGHLAIVSEPELLAPVIDDFLR
ncbi:alpha/beta fold hydrolase [Actinomycetospora sp. CA-084318]|uniref:alpha/beta fold hydrolase n=1 Tax=Actinomycetospora sp. CA-084318 TaxID=3239892 RepID=UPI003D95A17D